MNDKDFIAEIRKRIGLGRPIRNIDVSYLLDRLEEAEKALKGEKNE